MKPVNSVKFVRETGSHPPLPHPLLPNYVTRTKLSLMMFFTGFVLFIRLSALALY